MYLGDGYIAHLPRSCALRIFLHRDQHDVIERVLTSIGILLPSNCVSAAPRPGSAVVVVMCTSQHWPAILPQDGRGRKHSRQIALESWQEEIVREHPSAFLHGRIDSDGSRHRRIVRGRNYPAYSFSNRSEDILRLFGWACDLAGIRWRRSSRVAISIARRADVARLDAMFGYAPWASD